MSIDTIESTRKQLKIGIVAGEHSGDNLAAQLMQAILIKQPHTTFFGVSGSKMRDIGIETYADIEDLSVMGLFEVLKHLPRLLKLKKQIVKKFIDEEIDVFIGVDYQEFNHAIAAALKPKSIKTIQYVGPSVWGWRPNRIYKIKKILDHLLLLLPFEKKIYDQHQIGATYIGHPLAHNIAIEIDKGYYKQSLHLKATEHVVAILPGSRTAEIEHLLPVFCEAAKLYQLKFPGVRFIIPVVSNTKLTLVNNLIKTMDVSALDLTITVGNATQVLQAADFVFIASGTATLEAMLCKTPMVVAYKVNTVTAWIVKRLVTVDYMALPNLLANKLLVPEFKQEEVVAEALVVAATSIMSTSKYAELQAAFTELHESIRQSSSEIGAQAVLKVAGIECD